MTSFDNCCNRVRSTIINYSWNNVICDLSNLTRFINCSHNTQTSCGSWLTLGCYGGLNLYYYLYRSLLTKGMNLRLGGWVGCNLLLLFITLSSLLANAYHFCFISQCCKAVTIIPSIKILSNPKGLCVCLL